MPAATPVPHIRAYIALAGSLALHATLLICLELRLVPKIFDAEKPPQTLAVDFLRSKPSSVELASTRRPEKHAAPVASQVAPLSGQSHPTDPLEADAIVSPAASGPLVALRNLGQTPPTPILERDTPYSRLIARAHRPDCKSAYAGAGLFAIPLLLYDTARDKGCRW